MSGKRREIASEEPGAFGFGDRVVTNVAEGWSRGDGDDSARGTVCGIQIMIGQSWTPVLWDDETDPTFTKTASLKKTKR